MQHVFDRYEEPPTTRGFEASPSAFQVPRRRTDSSNRRLALIATAIGVSLIAVGGGLELADRRPTGIPVISADSRPIRVRPENPGGMQVIGAGDGFAADPANGTEALAPAPESPDPTGLHEQQQAEIAARSSAQMTAGTAAPADQPAAVPSPPARAVPSPQTTPAPVAAVAAPKLSDAPARPAATASATPGGGRRVVQLAAFSTEAAAAAEWERLAKRMPDLLAGRHADIVKYERDGRVVWRLRTAGFTDAADAAGFCDRVHAKGANCVTAIP